jgi:hypothetical protein
VEEIRFPNDMHSFDAAYTKDENETTSSLWQKIEEEDDNMLMKLECGPIDTSRKREERP